MLCCGLLFAWCGFGFCGILLCGLFTFWDWILILNLVVVFLLALVVCCFNEFWVGVTLGVVKFEFWLK